MLEYSRYEKDGYMYDSLHRRPQSTMGPERWYQHTDTHIEYDIFHDYLGWASDRLEEEIETGNTDDPFP